MVISSKNHLSTVLILIVFLTLFSCYEPIEDCLDLRGSNYSLSADEPCDDCCTFPNINVTFTPLWGEEALLTDSMYTNEIGQTFAISGASFFVSNILLSNESSRLVSQDSIITDCSDNVIYNSLANVSLQSRIAASRNVPITFGFDNIEFEVGVNACLSQADTLLFDSDFQSGSNFLNQKIADQAYLSASFELVQNQDTLTIDFINSEFNQQFKLAGDFEITQGSNLIIEIFVSYDELFSRVSFDDSIENIKSAINQNLMRAFTLME